MGIWNQKIKKTKTEQKIENLYYKRSSMITEIQANINGLLEAIQEGLEFDIDIYVQNIGDYADLLQQAHEEYTSCNN